MMRVYYGKRNSLKHAGSVWYKKRLTRKISPEKSKERVEFHLYNILTKGSLPFLVWSESETHAPQPPR